MEQLTLHRECSLQVVQPHNNTACIHPSKLLQLSWCSGQRRYRCHLETCTDVVFETRVPPTNTMITSRSLLTCSWMQSHPAARDYFQRTPALPHPEWYLQVFATPNVHPHVVLAEFFKVDFADDEQATSDHWRAYGLPFHDRKIKYNRGNVRGFVF